MQQEKKKPTTLIIGAFVVVLLGVATAWLIFPKLNWNSSSQKAAPGVVSTSKEAGKLDPNVKYDTATGILEKGGLNGEGTYHLVREGGASKYVALTSSMVDLDVFTGKNVSIWGDTLSSKRPGGWLMDVAKVQVTQ